MKDFIHKLLKAMNLGRRDWAVLLPALLLAFSIWLIHNLSLKYNDYLRTYVVAHCSIDGHSEVSANRCEVIARCRTTGWHILYQRLHGDGEVEVKIPKSTFQAYDGNDELFFISSDRHPHC